MDLAISHKGALLEEGRGPILSDGTAVADLFDLENKEISLRLLSDPEIYKLELERLFGRGWNFIAHESEVPNKGDFVMRYIGADPVIVVRQRDGEIKTLLNVCTHRGMQVCREDMGNAVKFRCPYHGWTWNRDGSFLSAPYQNEMYPDGLPPQERIALREARTGIFAGMVFATWDQEADPLDEWLGDYGYYMKLMLDRTNSGLEVTGPPQRFIIRGNWKTAGEQSNTDGYHGPSLHASLMVLNVRPGGSQKAKSDATGSIGVDVSCRQGHGIRCVDRNIFAPMLGMTTLDDLTPEESLKLLPPAGVPKELLPELLNKFTPGELKTLATFPPTVGGMFPNVAIFCPLNGDIKHGGVASGIILHAFVPHGPNEFEIMTWNLVEKDASEEHKQRSNQAMTFAFGGSGVFEVDDSEAWPSQQVSARGYMGSHITLKYNSLMGENRPDDWDGPGLVYAGFSRDDSQWNYWMRYRDFLMGNPWK